VKLRERFGICHFCWSSAGWTDPNTGRELCEKHLPPEPEPEVEGLDEATRAWLAEEITIIDPEFAWAAAPGITLAPRTTRKRRFDVLQCQWCLGVHSGACRRVRKLSFHPDGRPAGVTFRDEWDDSDVIWREQVFGVNHTEDSGKPTENGPGVDGISATGPDRAA
jgi:hypothetical protein